MMKKNAALRVTALLLCVLCAMPVLAGAEGVAKISSAAVALLCDTENVTVSATAKLMWDGTEFKQFDGLYMKQGMDNYMKVVLLTPVSDGSTRTGGYEVIGRTGDVWSKDYSDGYYTQSGTDPSNHIIRNADLDITLHEANDLMNSLGDLLITGGVTQQAGENGTEYIFHITENDVSPVAQAALLPLLRVAASRMGFGYVAEEGDLEEETGPVCMFEDEDTEYLLASKYYTELTGEEMPEEFYAVLQGWYGEDSMPDDDTLELADTVFNKIYDPINEIYENNAGGYFVIDAEGGISSYENIEQFILAYDLQDVVFQDDFEVMSVWYEKKYGKHVSAEAFGRALYSDDMEIAEIAGALYGEMYGEYSEQLKSCDGAVGGYVHRNGVLEPVYYYSDLDALVSYMTLTEKILNQMKTISVGSIDGTVLLGAGGELLSVKGTVCFNVTDRYGRAHTLTVETEVNVTDFGTTDLSGYTPDMWGVPDFSVWWEEQQQDYLEEMENVGQPEVITFNGIDYTV